MVHSTADGYDLPFTHFKLFAHPQVHWVVISLAWATRVIRDVAGPPTSPSVCLSGETPLPLLLHGGPTSRDRCQRDDGGDGNEGRIASANASPHWYGRRRRALTIQEPCLLSSLAKGNFPLFAFCSDAHILRWEGKEQGRGPTLKTEGVDSFVSLRLFYKCHGCKCWTSSSHLKCHRFVPEVVRIYYVNNNRFI